MKTNTVTLIDEEGNKEEVPIDDVILEYLAFYSFEECFDVMLDYLSLGDVQEMMVKLMTEEQKIAFLDEMSDHL